MTIDPQGIGETSIGMIDAANKPHYRIRDWDRHFEISQSRKAAKLSWVAIPNKHDGKGYRKLMRMEDGLRHYAAWVILVQVASKCPKRGVLADEDGPLSSEDLELKTGCASKYFEAAFGPLCEIKWLEEAKYSEKDSTGSTLPGRHQSATRPPPVRSTVVSLQNRTEQDRTSHNSNRTVLLRIHFVITKKKSSNR